MRDRTQFRNLILTALFSLCLTTPVWANGSLARLPMEINSLMSTVAKGIQANPGGIMLTAYLKDPGIHLSHSSVIADLALLDQHGASLSLEEITFHLRSVPQSALINMGKAMELNVDETSTLTKLLETKETLDVIPDPLTLRERLHEATDKEVIAITKATTSRLIHSLSTRRGPSGMRMDRVLPEELMREIDQTNQIIGETLQSRFNLTTPEKVTGSNTLAFPVSGSIQGPTLARQGRDILQDVERIRTHLASVQTSKADPNGLPPQKILTRALQEMLGEAGFRPNGENAVFGMNELGDSASHFFEAEDAKALQAAQAHLTKEGRTSQHLGRVYVNQYGKKLVYLRDAPLNGKPGEALLLSHKGLSSNVFLGADGLIYFRAKTPDAENPLNQTDYVSDRALAKLYNEMIPGLYPRVIEASNGRAVMESLGLGPSFQKLLDEGRLQEVEPGSMAEVFRNIQLVNRKLVAYYDSYFQNLILDFQSHRFKQVDPGWSKMSPDSPWAPRLREICQEFGVDPSKFIDAEAYSGQQEAALMMIRDLAFQATTGAIETDTYLALETRPLFRQGVPISAFFDEVQPAGPNRVFRKLLKGENAQAWLEESLTTLQRRVLEHNQGIKPGSDLEPIDALEAEAIFFQLFLVEHIGIRISDIEVLQTAPSLLLEATQGADDLTATLARNLMINWAMEGASTHQMDAVAFEGELTISTSRTGLEVEY